MIKIKRCANKNTSRIATLIVACESVNSIPVVAKTMNCYCPGCIKLRLLIYALLHHTLLCRIRAIRYAATLSKQ